MKGLTNAYNDIGRAVKVVENYILTLFDLIIAFLKENNDFTIEKKNPLKDSFLFLL